MQSRATVVNADLQGQFNSQDKQQQIANSEMRALSQPTKLRTGRVFFRLGTTPNLEYVGSRVENLPKGAWLNDLWFDLVT